MRRFCFVFLVLLTVGCLLLGGCGSAVAPNRGNIGEAVNDSLTADTNTQRKVIVTMGYMAETDDLAASVKALKTLVEKSGGYIESSSVSGEGDADGYGDFVLRIPVDQLNTLDEAMKQVGRVYQSDKNEEDITDQYYDVDARRQAKEAQRDRILSLLKKAESLSDLLMLEQELTDVQAELEALTGQLKRYDQQVTYATVTVSLAQSGSVNSDRTPFGLRLWHTVQDSFEMALNVVKGLLVVVVWLLPYGLFIAVVLIVVLRVTRKKRRARRDKSPDGKRETVSEVKKPE